VKILYLMHINWFWIRQRPHVVAELLAQRHPMMLLHYAMYRGQHKAKEMAPQMPNRLVYRLPGPLKRMSPGFEALDAWWIEQQVRRAVRTFQPDCVWVLHPVYERAIRRLRSQRIVYDCMDDHLEFVGQGTPSLAAAEQRLVERADLCVFSSQTLAERVNARHLSRRSVVVNNAVSGKFLQIAEPTQTPPQVRRPDEPVTFGYFGTISHWFDWDLVLRLLNVFPNARMHVVGPLETPVPDHSRITHLGVLPHHDLVEFSRACDILLMPFKVNRLIESVDPVKLYEYIALGVPTMAPRYRESERFVPYISVYGSHDEAIEQVRSLLDRTAAPASRCDALGFLGRNTWEVRGRQLEEQLVAL